MNAKRPIEIFQQEFLCDEARRERQTLLIVSAIGLAIAKTGLLPSRISSLGVEFSGNDQRAMLTIISALILYLLAAFCIHSFADYIRWKTIYALRLQESKLTSIANEKSESEILDNIDLERNKRILLALVQTPLPKSWRWVVEVRVFFDLGFPVLLALATVAFMLATKPHHV